MRSAKDFFAPLAVGAPAPVREVPARPSRAIHFFDPGNPKMAAKVPGMVGHVDVLLGNLEDAVKAENKEIARAGLVQVGQETDFGKTQFWTRIKASITPGGSTTWPTTVVPVLGEGLDATRSRRSKAEEEIHDVDRSVC